MAGSPTKKPEEGRKAARIEIIPLIDVIFFLLATFVLFTLSLNKLVSIDVTLPKAGDPTNAPPDDTMVTLEMSETGTCYWNKEPISVDQLEDRLKGYVKTVSNPRVLIAGDKLAHFGATVLALDKVRKAGIEQVSVETRVRSTGQ